jgi:FkbM family methyltransferase
MRTGLLPWSARPACPGSLDVYSAQEADSASRGPVAWTIVRIKVGTVRPMSVRGELLAALRSRPLTRQLTDRVRDLTGRRSGEDSLRLLLAFVLPADANCIDVGAHAGDVLTDILRLAPAGRHIAYEPLPHMAEELARRFPGVDVRAAALSDEAGEASFVHVVSNPAYSGLRERDYPGRERLETIAVRTERLDDTLPDGYVPTLIKVDVEGAELQVLRGARETLSRHRPVVFFEHGKGAADHYGTRASDIHDVLVGDAGLRIFDERGGGPYTRAGFEALVEGPIFNFVAHR